MSAVLADRMDDQNSTAWMTKTQQSITMQRVISETVATQLLLDTVKARFPLPELTARVDG